VTAAAEPCAAVPFRRKTGWWRWGAYCPQCNRVWEGRSKEDAEMLADKHNSGHVS